LGGITTRIAILALCAASLDALAERVIPIAMDDTMRYDPSQIAVKRGETVRFVATNRGKLVHEIVIGTKKALEEHAEHMRMHPDMPHPHEKNAVSVAPGSTGELTWRFPRAGTFYFGCLEPGHFEAGMVAKVTVR
jgi:uncharacterized cupredoxin-like copper-binding protein